MTILTTYLVYFIHWLSMGHKYLKRCTCDYNIKTIVFQMLEEKVQNWSVDGFSIIQRDSLLEYFRELGRIL